VTPLIAACRNDHVNVMRLLLTQQPVAAAVADSSSAANRHSPRVVYQAGRTGGEGRGGRTVDADIGGANANDADDYGEVDSRDGAASSISRNSDRNSGTDTGIRGIASPGGAGGRGSSGSKRQATTSSSTGTSSSSGVLQINARTSEGATALYVAVLRNHAAAVRLLLEAGADASIPDKVLQQPPFHMFRPTSSVFFLVF
jgi:ankyrin repeat protein